MEHSKVVRVLREMENRYGVSMTFQKFVERQFKNALGYVCEGCHGQELGPMVNDDLWSRIVPSWKDRGLRLCQPCMEYLLGRTIKEEDCKYVPWNILQGSVKLKDEGEMANRTLQAKRLKIVKMKRKAPRYLSAAAVSVSRYNSTSPYAMKLRAFPSPDAELMDKVNQERISADVIFDKPPVEFNSVALARVHTGLDRTKQLEPTAYQTWRNWRRVGKTEFNMINLVERRMNRLDLWFSGDKWIFIEEHYELQVHRASVTYSSKARALTDFNRDNIRWIESLPLETTV